MKKLLVLLLSLPLLSSLSAQTYMTTGGLRMGTDWGFTIQQRLLDRATGEFIFQSSLQREESIITFLFEHHNPLITKGFNVYYGAGLHKGWISGKENEIVPDDPFGITAVAGIEFTIARLNLSYDFKPAFNISGGEKNIYAQTGVSLRYVFLKNKVYKDMVKEKKKRKKQEEKDARREERGKDWWEVWKKKKG